MNSVQIIAYHGWGFSAGCWDPWRGRLADEANFRAWDRGYFGNPRSPEFGEEGLRVLLTHSLGLHLVPKSRFAEADLLVVVSGFRTFHPKAAQFRRRSRQVLRQMIRRFGEEPEMVLKKFYRNTWHPAPPPEMELEGMNRKLLRSDLRRLNGSEREANLLAEAGGVCIFHGTDDIIVPNSKGRDLHGRLEERSRYFEIRNAGHALPFTHPGKCVEMLLPELEAEASAGEGTNQKDSEG